ncbi:D-2-hydroxyacid dehydrogenase [Hydrogenimonas cancrithermarum]|uniref:2-hydroxyacid dehydrogenase n=1 Tax=Hydrogenimonas cancrithermarum TaxID=2993563 RepID=A0ABN6WVL8_9BACT|nr:D-2-hydroxyacid dehydrogenase [Hydrogenimonas cancrithermarum]BDY13061.1 2-hydroxyacid dehydrogenase [Hydrogenimonas cancrithermarum]
MKLVILDAKTVGDDIDLSVFETFGDVTIYQTTTPGERIEHCKDAGIVITNKVVIDKDVIDASPSLKLICVAATGMNNVDIEYANEKGIEVKNVAGYSTHSVVQHTFAMLFYLMEKLSYYDNHVKSKAWSRSGIFTCIDRPFHELRGKQWGIIGFGTIGKEVAKVAEAFGATVVYYSTSGENDDPLYPRMELDTLLSTSHIVSIHAPLNEKTRDLLDFTRLEKIQAGSILLNLGRGGIINETDLVHVMDDKEIYVGLDVTEIEPLPEDSILFEAANPDRLFITPHIAWTSIEARQELVKGIFNNIAVFLKKHTI